MDLLGIALMLLVVGFLLMAIEVLLIPGFGFAGLMGGALLLCGSGVMWHVHGPVAGLLSLAGSGGVAALGVWGFSKSKAAKSFVLTKELDGESGDKEARQALVGRTGKAATNLRPAGTADLEGERVDVVTAGEFVDFGTPIRVIEVEGFRVVVEAIPAQDTDATESETHG
jgi:membrane-bound serine protease (ClpP class)